MGTSYAVSGFINGLVNKWYRRSSDFTLEGNKNGNLVEKRSVTLVKSSELMAPL